MSDAPDAAGMRAAVEGLPDQLGPALARARVLEEQLTVDGDALDGLIAAGMGGSAIGADIVAAALADRLPRPMAVVRDYTLPAWAGRRTLVVATSFSGNTEETRAVFRAAGQRGCPRLAVTSGGQLAEAARAAGVPVLPLPPGGQPRAALGHTLASTLGVLRALGWLEDPSGALEDAATAMRALVASDARAADPTGLATALAGRLPVIYAPAALAPVARRWKTQLNENAKSAAAWDSLPELNHNTVVGYRFPPGLAEAVHVVLLGYAGLAPRARQRLEITRGLLDEHGWPNTAVEAVDPRPLVAALWHVQLGDLISVELAARYGVDPTPVAPIARLKAALADKTPEDDHHPDRLDTPPSAD